MWRCDVQLPWYRTHARTYSRTHISRLYSRYSFIVDLHITIIILSLIYERIRPLCREDAWVHGAYRPVAYLTSMTHSLRDMFRFVCLMLTAFFALSTLQQGDNFLHCVPCCKKFAGEVPYSQHVISEKHLKKMRESNSLNETSSDAKVSRLATTDRIHYPLRRGRCSC